MPREFDEEKSKKPEELEGTEEFGKFDYWEEKTLNDGQLLEVITPPPSPSIWSRIPVLILLGIVGVFIIWSLVSKILSIERYSSLSIISSPPGGLVYLDDEEKGLTPLYLPKIKVKEYNVKVVRSGFKQWDKLIKLEPKKPLELKVDLEDLTPPEITCYPPLEASVEKDLRIEATVKDNFQVGTVDLFYRKKDEKTYTCLKMIDSGNDVYWAVIPGNSVEITGVEYYIKATDGVNEVSYPENPLTPQIVTASVEMGKLTISSSPSGAKVYINGKLQKSETPIENLAIATGGHKIKIVKDGYLTWERNVSVKKEGEEQVSAVLKRSIVKKSLSSIFVNSNIKGANVFINKKSCGITPVKIGNLEPEDDYKITVEYEGKIVWDSTVTPQPGEEKRIFVEIASKYGKAYITSLPPGAKIYMENEFIGVTPLRDIKMPTGTHTLRAVMEGYPEKTKNIGITEDKISFLNFTLEEK